MKFAVIKTGGKQYFVESGTVLKVEKLPELEEGTKVVFNEVLLMGDDKGITIGTPFIEKASIEATHEGNGRNKKVVVIRYKSKTRQMKKKGHKQHFSKVKIGEIK